MEKIIATCFIYFSVLSDYFFFSVNRSAEAGVLPKQVVNRKRSWLFNFSIISRLVSFYMSSHKLIHYHDTYQVINCFEGHVFGGVKECVWEGGEGRNECRDR